MDDQEIKNEIVYTMVRKRITGSHRKQVATLVGMALPSHLEGRGKALVNDLVQAGVIERYGGGSRAKARLTSIETAVEYLERNDGDVPFGFDWVRSVQRRRSALDRPILSLSLPVDSPTSNPRAFQRNRP